MYAHFPRPRCGPPPVCGYPFVWVLWPQPAEERIVEEIAADATTPTKSALVGGHGETRLTVEYSVASGASNPSVAVSIVSPAGTTTSWSDPGPATGYHVYEGLGAVAAGSTVTLTVANAIARLRWCERLCC